MNLNKKYYFFIAIPIILVFFLYMYSGNAYSEEDSGIDFVFNDLNDKPVKLSDFRGRIVLVNVWATWCPPCREEIPSFINLYDKYKDKGFEIIGIATDKQGKSIVKPFAEKFKINYPLVVGDMREVVKIFGPIRGIPTTFLIDEKGEIKNKYIGLRSEEKFEEDIKKLLENIKK